jgi:plastocyanin
MQRRYGVRIRLILAASLAVVVHGPATWAGTVTGRVQLVEKDGRASPDLSDVVVYLDGARAKPKPTKAMIVMKGKTFTPHVVVIPVGGTVEFPNEDPILHNAFSVSGENRFDLDLYKKPRSASWTFQVPGIVRVYCNIHPQMSAVVVVRDNPYYSRAEADGHFTIEGVPAGKYSLVAWHERAGEVATDVTVTADGVAEAQLSMDASKYKRVAHKNKYGKDYSSTDEKY